jgi:thermitase
VWIAFAWLTPATQAQRTSPVAAEPLPTPAAPEPLFVPGQVIVRWSTAATREASTRRGLLMSDLLLHELLSIVQVDEGAEQRMAALLERIPGVAWAEPNGYVRAALTPNDPQFTQQWGVQKISAPAAWDVSTGSPSIITAVLDTGADLSHPDLQDRLVPGYNVLSPEEDPTDDSGHGTHIAGTIAATLNNQLGVAGVASGSRVMPIKVLDRRGLGMASNVALGMEWAADHGAKIVNMSFGTQQPLRILREAVDYARSKDIILVVAAGNEHENVPNFPGASSDAIAVAATDTTDNLAWFSNFGSWIDIGAPGVGIYSTFWNGGSNYEYGTGT